VNLEVKETSGSTLESHPVTLGIPLPEGAYSNLNNFRILGPNGQEVPSQITPMVRWWAKDSSIRFAQATFLVNVPGGGATQYSLEDGGAPSISQPLLVEENAERILVTTGKMRFLVRKGTGLLEQVWLDHDLNGSFSDAEATLSRRTSYATNAVTCWRSV
jgi:hypothetical protein